MYSLRTFRLLIERNKEEVACLNKFIIEYRGLICNNNQRTATYMGQQAWSVKEAL